jgi:hypothetical protein
MSFSDASLCAPQSCGRSSAILAADSWRGEGYTRGAGFTFEDRCSALYLTALQAETTAAGLPSDVVAGVALQRGSFGAPMDDIIVTCLGFV